MGTTAMPMLSPDGKFIAYSSDRAGDAAMDIWVQPLSEGSQPIRLTQRPGNEIFPVFSPDGGQIAFCSSEEGGGIYVMPHLGGTQRLLARGSFQFPRFSPDGQWIAANKYEGYYGPLYVFPVSGGPPSRLGERFYRLESPVWSPDGKKILASGRERIDSPLDWWIVPLDGGHPLSTGAAGMIPVRAGSAFMQMMPQAWQGDSILFGNRNLARIRISPEGKLFGPVERLTSGSGVELLSSVIALPGSSGWRIAYAAGRGYFELHRLRLAKNGAVVAERMFRDHVDRTAPSLSNDGRRLAYVSGSLGIYDLRVRNMVSGVEQVLLQLKQPFRAKISPDGSTVAFNLSSSNESDSRIFLVSTDGGDSRKLCDTCGLVFDWAPDSKRLNFRHGRPIRFSEVDIASEQKFELLSDATFSFYAAKYSPDGQWLALTYGGAQAPQGIFIAPLRNRMPGPADKWIRIMNRRGIHTRPWWSPDGNMLYFLSDAGSRMAIWSQKLLATTKQPDGEPRVIFQPDEEMGGRLDPDVSFGPGEGREMLIFPVVRNTGNIWIADLAMW
jgi:Tol biopolymer transport system component